MNATISIGSQSFRYLREHKCFFVDKTGFIKEWWEADDDVTLITRPRRFGKTLNLSMMNCFFSTNYAGRSDLFEGLFVWKEEKYRRIQGTWPVISLTFAGVKSNHLQGAKDGIIDAIANAYEAHRYLRDSDVLDDEEKQNYTVFQNYCIDPSPDKKIAESVVASSLRKLSMYLERYYHKKVLILLDEYDAPLQEAYVSGYWSEMVSFIRELFNTSFKTNEYLHHALLTGITRVSKESVFSDRKSVV